MKYFLVFFLLMLTQEIFADIKADTSFKPVRSISEQEWQRSTKDLEYPEPTSFKRSEKKTNSFKISQPEWLKFLLYTIITIFLAFLIFKLVRILAAPHNRKFNPSQVYTDEIEYIPEETSELEKFLTAAIDSGDYRSAIRISYLIAIRELAANKLIITAKDKTNYEYLNELISHPLFHPFREITRVFERTWYGEIKPGHSEYVAFENKFQLLRTTLTNRSEN